MMKKLLVVLVVLAMTVVSSLAFAEVTPSVEMYIRSRSFTNLDFHDKVTDRAADAQERVRLNFDLKAGDVKGRVTIENDWDTFGRLEAPQGNGQTSPGWTVVSGVTPTGVSSEGRLNVREAWLDFMVPGTPVQIKAGHMLGQLGNGWFFRSMKYGSDFWKAFVNTGANTFGLINLKVAENNGKVSDDDEAYIIMDSYKLSDTSKISVDLTDVKIRGAKVSGPVVTDAMNLGISFDGKVGPATLKAEFDMQTGKDDILVANATDPKYKGNQIVLQAGMPINDQLSLNATIGRGTGKDVTSTNSDNEAMMTILDADPRYTFMYEYKVANPTAGAHAGFANTTALGLGADFKASKSVTVGGSIWLLQSTNKVANVVSTTAGQTTNDLGQEIDVNIGWKLADNLSWNWTIGYLMPGDGLGKDTATGIQGVLTAKF